MSLHPPPTKTADVEVKSMRKAQKKQKQNTWVVLFQW